MSKILATCAAVAVTAVMALPAPAGATERRADGIQSQQQAGGLEFSDQRRRYYRSRYYSRRYYGGPRYYSGYSAPYYAYAPRPYYRPYYGPGVGVGIGPFGFGFGF